MDTHHPVLGSMSTTLGRLALRDEPGNRSHFANYIDRYRTIAQRMGCSIVDTSNRSEDASTAEMELIVLELLGDTDHG